MKTSIFQPKIFLNIYKNVKISETVIERTVREQRRRPLQMGTHVRKRLGQRHSAIFQRGQFQSLQSQSDQPKMVERKHHDELYLGTRVSVGDVTGRR